MTDLERLWQALDAADRLGQSGELVVNEKGSGLGRPVSVSKLEEELGRSIEARLNSIHLAGAAYDSKTLAVVVAVSLTEAIKLLMVKLGDVRLERSLDALEKKPAVARPEGG